VSLIADNVTTTLDPTLPFIHSATSATAPLVAIVNQILAVMPSMLKAVVNPRDVVLFVGFCFLYRRALKLVYQGQSRVLRLLRRGKDGPEIRPYEQSWLGFLEPRLRVFVRVLACLYVLNGALGGLANLGWRLIPGLREFISTVALTCYGGYFIDQLKRVSTRALISLHAF
jgi:hypothetical protein